LGTTDIFLLVIVVSSLLVGFFWGAARSLMLLAAWLGAFIAGAYLKIQLGSWLARQWTTFDAVFNDMAAFGIIFVGILILAPIAIVVGTSGDQGLSRYQLLDDVVGAAFAAFVAILAIGGVMVILSLYYQDRSLTQVAGAEWVTSLNQSLLSSGLGAAIQERLIPLLGAILGPLLPPDVRAVMT
jgi:uncharacterized membrane protein required for colicin V production